MSNSGSSDQAVSDIDSDSVARFRDKTCLRLRLARVFSSNALKSPKSPKSVSNSRGSSPSHGSPRARTRYSWQPGTYGGEENRSPCTSESGISTLSSSLKSSSSITNTTGSPKSPSTPKHPYFSYAADRYEVFAAAAAAATEAAKVGEQRRRVHGRHPQPDVAVRDAGAAQGLVDVVVDAGARLPFAVHRHVRLDARLPARVDAAPDRLLRPTSSSMDRAEIGSEKRRVKKEERERERVDRIVYLNNHRLNN